MQKASLVGCDAAVEHEDVRWKEWLSDAKSRWGFDFIRTVHKLWPSFSVKPLSKLIRLAEVVSRHFVLKQTKVALGFSTLLNPCEMWINICFAPLTSEWSIF